MQRPDFSKRSEAKELMDDSAASYDDFARALDEIRVINRYLSGTTCLLKEMDALFQKHPMEHCRVLDVGTGSADIPKALVLWGRRRGCDLRVTALDFSPHALRCAEAHTRGMDAVSLLRADVFYPPFRERSFDVVVASMFLHHFPQIRAAKILRLFSQLSRLAFIVNDLERHPVAFHGIGLLTRLFSKSRMVKNDAPLSVLRGFQKQDVDELRKLSELSALRLRRRWAYRFMMVWENKSDAS